MSAPRLAVIPVTVGLVPNTAAPVPVSSLSTPSSSALVVAAKKSRPSVALGTALPLSVMAPNVDAPAPNVPVVTRFSFPKLIAALLSVMLPPSIVMVPALIPFGNFCSLAAYASPPNTKLSIPISIIHRFKFSITTLPKSSCSHISPNYHFLL